MKKLHLSITMALLPLIVLAGIGYAAPALAQAERIALHGEEIRYFGPVDRVWFADGLVQMRGVQITGNFSFSGDGVTLVGTETQLANAWLDANGNGHAWGEVTYTDAATGVTCTGHVIGEITNFLATLTSVAPCSDGTLLKGTLQDVEVFDADQVPPPTWIRSEFTGWLLSPGQN